MESEPDSYFISNSSSRRKKRDIASSATAPKSSGPKSDTYKRDRRPSATHGTTRGLNVGPKKRKRANEEETADEDEEVDDGDDQEHASSETTMAPMTIGLPRRPKTRSILSPPLNLIRQRVPLEGPRARDQQQVQ